MAKQCMLTTFDNPYNPFTNFDEWNAFDNEKGYTTCGYLSRVADLPTDLSEEETKEGPEMAIDQIIEYDFLNIYKKVYMDDSDSVNNY